MLNEQYGSGPYTLGNLVGMLRLPRLRLAHMITLPCRSDQRFHAKVVTDTYVLV